MSLLIPHSYPFLNCALHHTFSPTLTTKPCTSSLTTNKTTTTKTPLAPLQMPTQDPNPTSMWLRCRAALSQRFNSAGIVSSAAVVARDNHLAVPHLSVPDIRWVDWAELAERGFRGVVFDKDNTLTAPYSLRTWPSLSDSLDLCKSAFGGRVAIYSNSAGLYQYDPDDFEAKALEEATGIPVIRHVVKKPAGTAEDIEKYFGCTTSSLLMVGDRHFTDIVYGNRNGFLTILVEPLSLAEESFIVKQVRKLEASLVNGWNQKGVNPTSHRMQIEAKQCVKHSLLEQS